MASQGYQNNSYALVVRPMNAAERKAAADSLKPARYNAIAMSILGIATAIMINYARDTIVVVVPLMFAAGSIAYASQYRKGSGTVSKMLTTGTVPEIRGVPTKKSMGRGWDLGPASFQGSGGLGKRLSEGTVTTLAFLPDTKVALSVNGVPLKKPVPMVIPAGFGKDLTVPAKTSMSSPGQMTAAAQQPIPQPIQPSVGVELPPPPEDWDASVCGRCGQINVKDARFCAKCGASIQK